MKGLKSLPFSHLLNSSFISSNSETSPDNIKNNSSIDSSYSFRFSEICYTKLKLLVKKIEIHKNSGLHNLSSHLFKTSMKILLPQFRFLLNLALTSGIFSQAWKETTVTPLFKTGSKTDPSN